MCTTHGDGNKRCDCFFITGVHWVDGNAQFSINWDNEKGKIGGYSAKHLPEKNGNFCVSANDIKGRLRVKDCDIQQKYACEVNKEPLLASQSTF